MAFQNQTVIGAVLQENRTEILLVKRRDVPVWVLPGGGIERGESLESAVEREVEEETGFRVKVKRKVGEYTPINRLSRYTHFFECEIIDGKAQISDETKSVRFFSIDHLPKLIPPPHDEWIVDAQKNHTNLIHRKLTRVNYPTLIKNFFLHPILVIRFLLSKIGCTINT